MDIVSTILHISFATAIENPFYEVDSSNKGCDVKFRSCGYHFKSV